MKQYSWDAVLLGAVTLIAAVNGALTDENVTAVAQQTNFTLARSDAPHTPVAEGSTALVPLTRSR